MTFPKKWTDLVPAAYYSHFVYCMLGNFHVQAQDVNEQEEKKKSNKN